jgi:hypothetical protein
MTQTIRMQSRVGHDGVLTLQVPLSLSDANTEVLVTIEPVGLRPPPKTIAQDDWHQFVVETYGSCAGLGLERHDQGLSE